jgi:hypothetical protein
MFMNFLNVIRIYIFKQLLNDIYVHDVRRIT